jgi:SET family sugar efflux transporter-like MFS transporter
VRGLTDGPVRYILRRHEYRALYVAFFMMGAATSCAISFAALRLTSEMMASPSDVGLFFLVQLLAPAASIGTGWMSDRLRNRMPLLRGCTIWLAAGWLLFGLTTNLASALFVGAIFLCFTGAVNAQLFVTASEQIVGSDESRRNTITSTLRGGNAVGAAIGPAMGGLLATGLGLRSVFVSAAILYLLVAGCTLWLGSSHHIPDTRGPRPQLPAGRSGRQLWAYGAGITLVLSGDAMKLGYMPLLVVDHLGHSPMEFGVLMSASAIVELVAFPLAGLLADKIGQAKVIAAALMVGAVDYSLLALTSSIWQLYVVQLLHVAVIVGMFGVGITYLQGISPRRPGLASSTFFAAQGIATPLGGLAGGLGVGTVGLPGMFWLPAAFCLLCGISFAILTLKGKPPTRCGL